MLDTLQNRFPLKLSTANMKKFVILLKNERKEKL